MQDRFQTLEKTHPGSGRLLIDSHLDLAWNAVQWNRDLTQPVQAIRTSEAKLSGKGRGEGTVALPELKEAGIGIAFVTTLARCTGHAIQNLDFSHPSQAFAVARGHTAYYQALERTGEGKVLHTAEQLVSHLQALENWRLNEIDSLEYPGLGMALCMESADPILTPDELPEWIEQGIWLIGPAHYGPGRYSGGTGSAEGFTDFGFELLKNMEQLGVSLDVTHLSETAFNQAMDCFGGQILASHNNCRHLVNHQRQITDRQIREIAARDGVIGVAFDAWMMQPDWVKGKSTNKGLGIERIVEHIDHICQLTGNILNVGIGSDLDGGFGKSQSPEDIDTIADLFSLQGILARRGYSKADIDAIFYGNFLRKLERGLAAKSL